MLSSRSLSLSLSTRRVLTTRLVSTTRAAMLAELYTKQEPSTHGELITHDNGTRTYVVSSVPDRDAAFGVPPGAFQTLSLAPELGPSASAPPHSPTSSSSASPAHPTTTRQALDGTLTDRNPAPSASDGQKGLGAWADRK